MSPIHEREKAVPMPGRKLEWYQWLAERLIELEQQAGRRPACEAHRDWQPPREGD